MTPDRTHEPRDDPKSLSERLELMELAWLMTAVVAFLAVAVPWFFQALTIDLKPIVWTLFAFAALSLLTSWAAQTRVDPRAAFGSMLTVHLLGIGVLAGIWHLAGGTGNPSFLLLFVLPVMTGLLPARSWLPYLSAGLAIMAVTAVAVGESTALRWYLARLGVPLVDRLENIGGWLDSSGGGLFGLAVPPALLAVTLVIFVLALLSVAFIGQSMTALINRLYRRLALSSSAREDAELLYSKLLQGSPEPTVVVYADSGRIVQASDSFVRDLLLDREHVVGASLLDVVQFSYPDVVRGALAGGEVPNVVYRVDGESRVGHLHATRIRHRDTDYVSVTLRDVTDVRYLHAALDSGDEPCLLLDGDERVVFFNRSAGATFDGLEVGVAAARALAREVSPDQWWRLGLRPHHHRSVEVAGAVFETTLSRAALPGEQDALTVVRMSRQARA